MILRRLLFFFFLISLSPVVYSQIGGSKAKELISFEKMKRTVIKVYPEAIESYMSYSTNRKDDVMMPVTVEFYIAEHYFKDGLIDFTEIDHRTRELVSLLELEDSCPYALLGKKESPPKSLYLNEKRARLVTIYFGIGCENK